MYPYRTSGGEQLSVAGISRSFPSDSEMIVTDAGCATMKWEPLEQHTEGMVVCPAADGALTIASALSYEEIAGTQTTSDIRCPADTYLVPPDPTAGARWRTTCHSPGQNVVFSGCVVGSSSVDVGGHEIPALHTRLTLTFSGAESGTNPNDYWIRTGRRDPPAEGDGLRLPGSRAARVGPLLRADGHLAHLVDADPLIDRPDLAVTSIRLGRPARARGPVPDSARPPRRGSRRSRRGGRAAGNPRTVNWPRRGLLDEVVPLGGEPLERPGLIATPFDGGRPVGDMEHEPGLGGVGEVDRAVVDVGAVDDDRSGRGRGIGPGRRRGRAIRARSSACAAPTGIVMGAGAGHEPGGAVVGPTSFR